MKAIILIFAALAQLLLVAAQPHGHRHLHAQRSTDIVTDTVTVAAAEIVWVDEQGHVVSTEYETSGYTNPTFAAPSSTPSSPPPTTTTPPPLPPTTTAAPPPPPPSMPFPPSSSRPAKPPASSKFGITYSPYTAASGCKSSAQIASDLAALLPTYSLIRLYGVDCNQVSAVASAISGTSTTLFLGLVDLSNLDTNLASMASQLSHNWSPVDTISIGNELVNNGAASVSDVVSGLSQARDVLRGFGYSGPVVTVDTFDQLIAHPELCGASDYCTANCHAYFDNQNPSSNAGPYVSSQAAAVSKVNGGKRTLITESGWPHGGDANGAAVASTADQATAIASLKAAFPGGGLILFNAYDDQWKTPGAYGVEQSFGIYGH